ncbi:MAG: GntR family transcriptional regulator [Burkholderiaceae bacterium]
MSAVIKFGVNSAQPLYQVARAQLVKALAGGQYRPGTALPPEKTLSAEFGISIGTLRKAVDELVAEGILIRQQGRGTFVASHDQERLLYYFFHIVPFDGGKTEYPVVELIDFKRTKASAVVAQKLALRPGDPIFEMRNRLSLGGQALIVDDISLPAARFRGLTAARIRDRDNTLYQLYQEAFGLSVAHTSERLRAVIADDDMRRLLDLPAHSPAMMIRRIAFGYEHEPIEWRVSHVDTRTHEYLQDTS